MRVRLTRSALVALWLGLAQVFIPALTRLRPNGAHCATVSAKQHVHRDEHSNDTHSNRGNGDDGRCPLLHASP